MAERNGAEGPVVVWQNYGYEGWSPTSYDTLKEALAAPRLLECVVMRVVEFDVVEKVA